MKPYFLVAYNILRAFFWKVNISNVKVKNPLLIGYNTKCNFSNGSKIQIESHLVSDGRFVIIVGKEGELTIKDNVYFNEGGMISCHGRVNIGSGCRFGPNVKIFDNNHCFSAAEGVSDLHKVGEILIGDHCWIGSNAVLLKGAKIGENCVIGAGCIVDREIPPHSIVTQGRGLEILPMREA